MSVMRRLRLHHRLVIPFAVIAVAATAATAYVALSVTRRALESRVEAQIVHAATLVSQSDFALNATILASVKPIAGADVITFDRNGDVLVSTVAAGRGAFESAVVAAGREEGASPRVRRVECDGPCIVAYSPMASRPGVTVAVATTTSDLTTATRVVTRTIVAAAVLGVLVMVLVSQAVARRITAPLDGLVRFSREVEGGRTPGRAAVGDDEVGRLGTAFNDMLDRLDRSRDALVRSEKLALAGLFAARVAHDIRNPLSSIKMQTQLLQAQLRDERSRAVAAAMLRDIAQVESVIRDLLEVARPGELHLQPTSINAVIGDVLRQMAPQLSHRKIDVDERLDDALPPIALDVGRIRQALLNVVNNAAEAMPNGGTLTVETRATGNGSAIELVVADDGTGVDPAVLDRVFDPFVSTKPNGVGLGLVNVRAVVERHGGRVELAPASPAGTRATMWLPVRDTPHG